MTNKKIITLTLVLIFFTIMLTLALARYETGETATYSNDYLERYFQSDQVMEINIEIDNAAWSEMMENPMAEEFKTATVTVNGDVYPLVRIRTKGNSSLMSVAQSDSNRYSFKINFDGIHSSQSMAGLTQLNLNNNFSDPSSMREYLSYQIFEEMGVAVPAFGYAAVYINGEYVGLYLAVEGIKEPYLERNFGNFTGDLYKSVGHTLDYQGTDPANYTGLEVKSTLKNADWSKLTKMLDALNNNGEIEKHLDIDAALRYIAVSTALANFDSYQGNFGHNYYLYEQEGVFTILPWDLNMSFGGFSFGSDATAIYIDEPTQGSLAERPLIAKLFENKEYLQTYHGYLEEVATSYLNSGYLEAETARLFDLISEYVRTDPTAFYTFEQFESSISGTITGSGMGKENPGEMRQENPTLYNDFGGENNRIGGMHGMGGNVPGILELAETMSDSILKQLSGELSSTNNGMGMGGSFGMPMDRMQNANGDRIPGQAGMLPFGEEMPVEGMDMATLESFLQEVMQAGDLTEELRSKARELGISDDMIEMMTARQGGARAEGMRPAMGGDNFAFGMNPMQSQPNYSTLLVSVIVIIAGIIMVLLFKRKKYIKT